MDLTRFLFMPKWAKKDKKYSEYQIAGVVWENQTVKNTLICRILLISGNSLKS